MHAIYSKLARNDLQNMPLLTELEICLRLVSTKISHLMVLEVGGIRLLKSDRWLSIVFQHWDTSYFAAILQTASECGGELKAAITQTGDVIWSMHKKKNSASVLSGEMILTFYKPAKIRKLTKTPESAASSDPSKILSDVFDVCLNNGTTSFASEALFNRLVIELWRRHALSCLNLDREEFARQLEQRGWSYNTRNHTWSKPAIPKECSRK